MAVELDSGIHCCKSFPHRRLFYCTSFCFRSRIAYLPTSLIVSRFTHFIPFFFPPQCPACAHAVFPSFENSPNARRIFRDWRHRFGNKASRAMQRENCGKKGRKMRRQRESIFRAGESKALCEGTKSQLAMIARFSRVLGGSFHALSRVLQVGSSYFNFSRRFTATGLGAVQMQLSKKWLCRGDGIPQELRY